MQWIFLISTNACRLINLRVEVGNGLKLVCYIHTSNYIVNTFSSRQLSDKTTKCVNGESVLNISI